MDQIPCSSHDDLEKAERIGHLNALLGSFDDDDYDNIADAEDIKSIAETLKNSKRKLRKLSQLPEKFALICQTATDLFLQGKYQAALEAYQDVAEGVKNYAPIYNLMSECYQSLGQPEEAFDCCKKATDIDRQYAEAWMRYTELADTLGMEDNLIIGLKATIGLNAEHPESILSQLHRLVDLLNARGSSLAHKFQKILFKMELEHGRKPECYVVAAALARNLLKSERYQAAFEFLDGPISSAIEAGDCLPEDTVLAYVETLIGMKQPDRAAEILLRCEVMSLTGPPDAEAFEISNAESVDISLDTNLSLVAAVCLIMVQFDNYKVVEHIMTERIMAAESLSFNKLFLDLAVLMLEKNHVENARLLLVYLQQQPGFQSPEFYLQLGTALERLGDFKQALDAYNRAVSLKPSIRSARYRIRRLGLPVPSTANLGTAEERERTIFLQKKIFEEYTEAKNAGDRDATLRLSIDLVSSTFGYLEDLRPEEIVFDFVSPFRIKKAVEPYMRYAPAIATNGIQIEEFWEVVVNGCQMAVARKKFDDLLVIAFHAMCTADLIQSSEKVEYLNQAIVLAGYHLGYVQFCLRYFRDGLIASKKADYRIATWNFFYQLICESRTNASHALFKWALRWTQVYGYSRELIMIMANDSMRRENNRHAFELYYSILRKEGINNVPWYILLYTGIVYLNLACRCHCSQRLTLYVAGMHMLEKYGMRRGKCPEVLYNKGRAAQQFGDAAEAIGYYQECLELSKQTKLECDTDHIYLIDYTFKAAYNLRGIYISLNQPEKADEICLSVLSWKKIRTLCED